MNRGLILFLGIFLTFAFAWLGMVIIPTAQLADPRASQQTAGPRPYSQLELAGRRVYMAEGCAYCHTQQLRGGLYQADTKRDWGDRRSHPLDYIHDNPVLLGTMRTGPDLSNIAVRRPDARWHLLHLYNPQKLTPGSLMAPYRHLFEKRRIGSAPSPDALDLDGWTTAEGLPQDGFEIVPTERATALAAYLLSLNRMGEIPPEVTPR